MTTTTAPVYTAIQLAVSSLSAALGPNAHWQRNDNATPVRPYLIFESQDTGGVSNPYIGSDGWRGLFTVRAVADYQDEADAALEPVDTAMRHLNVADGYTISAVYIKPITIPPTAEVRYAARQWELFIERI